MVLRSSSTNHPSNSLLAELRSTSVYAFSTTHYIRSLSAAFRYVRSFATLSVLRVIRVASPRALTARGAFGEYGLRIQPRLFRTEGRSVFEYYTESVDSFATAQFDLGNLYELQKLLAN